MGPLVAKKFWFSRNFFKHVGIKLTSKEIKLTAVDVSAVSWSITTLMKHHPKGLFTSDGLARVTFNVIQQVKDFPLKSIKILGLRSGANLSVIHILLLLRRTDFCGMK